MADHVSFRALPADDMQVIPRTLYNNAQEEEKLENMWETSVSQIQEEEKDMTDAWVDDANGILAFTGLFSATIGAFIIEFYKKLSPDSGGQTVTLLEQISQQLTNSRNGTPIVVADQLSVSPSVSIIWVNAMWLTSLVFSLTSALIILLNQQAVRRYIETSKVPKSPNDHARVRALLFREMILYKMPLAIFVAPTLLHLSIYLFFGGLVIAFHTIYEKVAIVVDAAVGVSGLVYLGMSLLPLLDLRNCPYRTPVTYLLLYSWHAFLYCAAYCGLLLLARRLPGSSLCPSPLACICPDPPDSDGLDGGGSGKRNIFTILSNSIEKAVKEHGRYLREGPQESVVNHATNPLEHEDRKTITWLFKHLSRGDKNKFQVFAASIPRDKVTELIPPIKSGKIVLREPLLDLFQSCTNDTLAGVWDMRKTALLVCLTAIRDIAKEPIIPDLNFVRGKLANISRMRVLWNESADSIRIASRSICALVARQVARKRCKKDADLNWLEEVTGVPPVTLLEPDITATEWDRMNFKSFVHGALPHYVTHLSTEDETSFKETLAILLDIRTDSRDWQTRLSEEVRRKQQDHPEDGFTNNRLQLVFPSLSAAPSPEAPTVYRAGPSSSVQPSPSRATSGSSARITTHYAVPPSPVIPSSSVPPRSRMPRAPPVVHPPRISRAPPAVPPLRTSPSPPTIYSPPTFPSSTTISSPPRPPPRPRRPSHPRQPSLPVSAPRAPAPSPDAVPPPSVPPPPDMTSPPPPHTPRRSLTARPPHAPI